MILRIGFKTPDAVDNALQEVPEDDRYAVKGLLKNWIQYGECITVEVDTEKETCEVVLVNVR